MVDDIEIIFNLYSYIFRHLFHILYISILIIQKMNPSLFLSPTKPLYVDRRFRPTYPNSSTNPSPISQSKHKLDDMSPKDHSIQNWCYKSIEWHIQNTFFMKKQLKLMLTNYFAKRNAELNELKEKNQLENRQRIARIQTALQQLLHNKKTIYRLLKHSCTKHKSNNHIYSRLDAIKQNIDEEQQDGLVNLDCDDCLKIFTKFFVKKNSENTEKNMTSDENLEKPTKEVIFKRIRQKQRTSIMFSEKVSIPDINSRKMVDNITILDSLLDIEIFNSLTKKKIESSANSIKLKHENTPQNSSGYIHPNKRAFNKRESGFKPKNHEETKPEIKSPKNNFNVLKQSLSRSSRVSGADRFYQVIKEAIKTKDIFCEKTQEADQIDSSQNSLTESQCNSKAKKKIEKLSEDHEDSNQSQSEENVRENIRKQYRKKNKLTSRQGYLKRQRKQKSTLKTDTAQPKQLSEVSKHNSKSPKISREKNKVRTGNIKKSTPKFIGKKAVPSKNKKNVVVKQSDVKQHEDTKKMNRSRFTDKIGLSKYSRHDKSLTGKERIHSFRRIRKRQVFLKKNKEKSLQIKFRSISSESQDSNILEENQSQEHGYSLSLLPKLTKYEAAREKFRKNYYQNSETYRINLCNVDKPSHNQESGEESKQKSKRQKRPSINSLVPDTISVGYNRIPSKRSYNDMKQESILNILNDKFNEPIRQNQKKLINQSSKALLNILNNGLNNSENNLRETKINIKYYLNRHKTNPKVLELLNFFTYMEQTLQQDLNEKSRFDDLSHLALEADIQKVQMQNFMAELNVNSVEDYEGCKFENQNLNFYSQSSRREPYEQRFITKLNNGVLDLLYWDQGNKDYGQEELELLDQISLKQIEEIKVL